MENKKKREFINCPVIIFAENPIEIKKKAKISFLLEILLKMKNEKMKKKYDSLLEWDFDKLNEMAASTNYLMACLAW